MAKIRKVLDVDGVQYDLPFAEGAASETIEGCVRIYEGNDTGFPVIEVYARRDEHGNCLDSDNDIEKAARHICRLLNEIETEYTPAQDTRLPKELERRGLTP